MDGLTEYIQKAQFGIGFEKKNEGQGQPSPKTVLWCISGTNLEILALVGLSHGVEKLKKEQTLKFRFD